ncbi:MAG: VIT1/CCC1 transporter family protein [Deferribacterota bacterium]|nr:VIT1/CCC1 transporter family protein [Deferribacterota bacterium]
MKKSTLKNIKKLQKNEITEYYIYKKIALNSFFAKYREILDEIANDEKKHYLFWRKYTNKDVKPNRIKIIIYFFIVTIFGLTFGLKFLEKNEDTAQKTYNNLKQIIPDIEEIIEDEHSHEEKLLELINEERLNYISSIVLGLNDALIELTGALAGFIFALRNTELIAVAGLITGIAASLSMSASEYLSKKTEKDVKRAIKSSLYTGSAYIITVIFLVIPFFLCNNPFIAIIVTFSLGILIIFLFNYYLYIAKGYNLKKTFIEMAIISFTIALLSFFIGYIVKLYFGIEI